LSPKRSFLINILEGKKFNTYVKPYGLTFGTLFPSLLGEYLRICDPTLKDFFLGQNFGTWRGK
jgi:hypothetical protein